MCSDLGAPNPLMCPGPVADSLHHFELLGNVGTGIIIAGVAMFAGNNVRYAVCTENGPELVSCEGMLPGKSA